MLWEYSDVAESLVDSKSREWHVSKCLSRLLLNRGINTDDRLKDFLNPHIDKFRDPFDFERMNEVVKKIVDAKEKGEKIFVYGDYDVDGITAATFLVLVFRQIGIDVDYYIPNRMEEGYGLDRKAINYINNKKGRLVITVDTGVNSIEDVEYANRMGIDVIITDHHKIIKEKGDEQLLIINPKFSEGYQFKFLAGAGVALKVAQAVYMTLGEDLDKLYQYIDIVMIGTVADVVPMIDENRIIIRKGLEVIKKTKVKGLTYLMKYLRLQNKDITTTDVSFFISPLLNSLGRIGTSKVGADFFINEDDFEIYNIIEEMKKSNKKRRELERSIFNEIDDEIQNMQEKNFKYLFLKSSKWHPGVIGVVSSRLSIKYHVPVVLVAIKDGVGKASCRSIEGINIFNILREMADKLLRFGGHDLASGFIARTSNLDEIEERLKGCMEISGKKKEMKTLRIDGTFSIENIDENMLKDLERVSPYGLENEHPIFLDEGLEFENLKKFGVENRHFKAFIKKDGKRYSAVAFDLGSKIDEEGYKLQRFDVAYYPEKVYYKGDESLQIRIKDFKVKDDFYNIFTQ
jgi:single-stranded-DNA-specific exonuclease